jgi:hypothetical protein
MKDIPKSLIRKRDKFFHENGTLFESYPSISQARRRSRLLQAAGCKVQVDKSEDPKPKPRRDRGDAADRFIAQAIRKEQAERIAKAQEKKGPNTLSLRKQA